MSLIKNDTFPIDEIKSFLIGKTFCRQSESTVCKVVGVIKDVSLSFKMVFVADLGKTFFKPVIKIQSSKNVWYDLHEIWLQSVMTYEDYGGTVVMDAISWPFTGTKLKEQ